MTPQTTVQGLHECAFSFTSKMFFTFFTSCTFELIMDDDNNLSNINNNLNYV